MNRMIARLTTVLFAVIFVCGTGHGQPQLEIRKKISPLKTTKTEVEKIGHIVDGSGDFFVYETPNERLKVYYTAARCRRDGWNVPKDRVLSFQTFPKTPLAVESLNIGRNFVKRGIDDILTQAATDPTSGIVYAIPYSRPYVDYIRFFPSRNNQDLRCKGFPAYDPVRSEYAPHMWERIDRVSDWDATAVGEGTILRVHLERLSRGYVIVYASKGHFRDAHAVIDRLRLISRRITNRESRKRIRIQFGGYRDNTEIETFMLWPNEAPPLPTPTYPR